MHSTLRRGAAALLATFAATTGPLSAQNVLIHEIRADAGGRWIEFHNRGSAAVDLSTWTIYHASLTPSMPQTYWWPFPSGTSLAAGGYLRVHWFQATPTGGAAPGDLWTGNTPWDFLFGLGGENLLGARGAIGLLRSQQSSLMSSPSVVEDWVSWGQTGFSREFVAATAGVWTEGRFAPSIPSGQSLARNTAAVDSVGFEDEAWFVDVTPTPLQPNLDGAMLQSYGTPCTLPGNHLLGGPVLHANGQPLLGNAQFGLGVDNTTGIYGEFVLFALGTGMAPVGQPSLLPPFAGTGCTEVIDTFALTGTWLQPAQILTTTLPMPLHGLPATVVGIEVHAQALVVDLAGGGYPPYQGLSNALRVVVGQ